MFDACRSLKVPSRYRLTFFAAVGKMNFVSPVNVIVVFVVVDIGVAMVVLLLWLLLLLIPASY